MLDIYIHFSRIYYASNWTLHISVVFALPYLTLLRLPYFDKLSLHNFRHVFVVYIFFQIYPLPSFKLDSPHISHLLQAPIALPQTSTCLDKVYLLGFRKKVW